MFTEMMLLHVDNLRRSYEKEHTELEETRRVLIEHKLLAVGSRVPGPVVLNLTFQADETPTTTSTGRATRNRSVSVMHTNVTMVIDTDGSFRECVQTLILGYKFEKSDVVPCVAPVPGLSHTEIETRIPSRLSCSW